MKTPKGLPDKATVCTVRRDSGLYYVNCAGFKHPFREPIDVAKFLDIPWEQFADMLDERADVLILLRHKGKPWHSSRPPME
jgi:hypothetical protein